MRRLTAFWLVSIYAVQRAFYFYPFSFLIALQSSLLSVFQSRLYRSIVMGLRQALGSTRSDLSFVFRKSAGKDDCRLLPGCYFFAAIVGSSHGAPTTA